MSSETEIFFYGLFMDVELLINSGAMPSNPRRAYVDDFMLRLGRRAALVPAPGARVYGMVMTLTHLELESLYGTPGLEHYYPEAVLATLFEGGTTPALCYNLLPGPDAHEVNPEYAQRLKQILTKLDFPAEYVASVV